MLLVKLQNKVLYVGVNTYLFKNLGVMKAMCPNPTIVRQDVDISLKRQYTKTKLQMCLTMMWNLCGPRKKLISRKEN